MGMTYGAHHRPSNMLAGFPEVPMASAQEDQLHPKGQLCQQLASDSTKENRSRAMKTKLPNGCLAKSRLAPIGATEAKDGMTPATTGLSQSEIEDPSPRWDPRQKRRDMPSRCRPRGKALYKVPLSEQGQRSRQGRRRRGAGSRPSHYLTCNQAPTYIRGLGPLV
jgi:hypothetical protein